MHPIITSAQNSKIKNILALEKPKERKNQNLFVIEGTKELGLAIQSGYKITSVFFLPPHFSLIMEVYPLLIPE